MKQRITIQKIALVFVGSIFLLSYVNKALFTHTHILPDGRIIAHAHPYLKKKTHDKNLPEHSHHHTANQYYFLNHHYTFYSGFHFLRINMPHIFRELFFQFFRITDIFGVVIQVTTRDPPLL